MKEAKATPEDLVEYQSSDTMKDTYKAASGKPGGILLFDDDPDVLETFMMILEGEGYNVYAEDNLDRAVTIIKEHDIRLAIIDYILPGISGVQVARTLKKIDDKLLIVFLSGYYPIYDTVNNIDFKVHKIFLKPVNIDEIISTLKSIYD